MSSAEIYRQKELSSLVQTARYIFASCVSDSKCYPLEKFIIEIKTGKTPHKNEKKFYEDEFIGWYKPSEIGNEKYLIDAKEKLSKYAYDNGQVTIYSSNTILINAIGDVGRIAILKHEASSNQQITGIKLHEGKLLTEYCYYYLLANRQHFYKDLFRTTLPIVNQKKIKAIPIPVPSLKIQSRIIDFLNELELIESVEELDNLEGFDEFTKIAKQFFILKSNSNEISTQLTQQLTLVQQLRQAFLREAMQGKLLAQDPNEEPASVLLKKIKQEKERLIKEKKIKKSKALPAISKDEIPFDIPEGWVWCRGDMIANYIDPQPSHRTPPESRENIPYVAMKDINKDGSINFLSARKVGNNVLEEHKNRYSLKLGDFIFGKIGTIGKPVKLPEPFNYTLSANVILIQADNFIISSEYLFYFLSSPIADKILIEKRSTMSYPVFGMGKARMMTIPLPPLAEQQRIVAKLDELMGYCDGLEASIKASQGQNELLLQQVLREALEPKG